MLLLQRTDMMNKTDLKWSITDSKLLLHTPIFDVNEQHEIAATGIEGDYVAMDAPDWAMVIAEYRGSFVLVRQWRHSAECLSLEFPGGMVDDGEDAATASRRELMEETGFEAGRLTHLGTVSPNPALFKNRFHVYLAEDLKQTGTQSLDHDELLTYELMPTDEVVRNYGKGEFAHALMGTALMFYLRHRQKN